MAEIVLSAEARPETGSAAARRLRAAGKVPATLYGRGSEPRSLFVDARELSAALHTDAGMNVLIDLHLGSDTHLTMARQLERHPVKGTILHVDLLKIARDQRISVEVPISFEGTSKGVKEGAQLDHHVWHVTVECLVTAVPEKIVVDITEMVVGDVVRVGDLVVPEGAVITTGADEVVVSCVTPTEMKVEAELEEAAPLVEGEEGEAEAEGEEAAEGEAGAEAPAAEG